MAASFGEQLKVAREERGIALREISDQTHIPTHYLEAIEANDYKRLPGGIFNKSFIKAYAKYIGYDEKEALEAYARTAREQGTSPDDVVSTPYQPRVYTDGNSRSPLVTLLLTILILAILSLGVYAAMHWYQRREAAPADNAQAPNIPNNQTGAPGATAPNASSTAATGATATTLNVQVRALGERVWIKTRTDDGDPAEDILEPSASKEFKVANNLNVQFSRSKLKALEITINGRTARNLSIDPKSATAILNITKDNYEQFLQ
jgi:cytoskeleton protein RodZ